MENIEIKGVNAENFVRDLWGKITGTGFNAMSKNDFYDYVLYLFNKYNAEPFLDVNSNYKNSQLLRVSEQKLKNSSHNIYLKYYEDDEKEKLLKLFFEKIADRKITLKTDNEDDIKQYHLVIEDVRIRTQIEGILKDCVGTTLDYHFNTELVKLEANDFNTMFFCALAKLPDASALQRKMARLKSDKETEAFIAAFTKALAAIAKGGAAILVENLIPAAKIIYRGFPKTSVFGKATLKFAVLQGCCKAKSLKNCKSLSQNRAR